MSAPFVLLLIAVLAPWPATGAEAAPDPLGLIGLRATEGAAAGYVPDVACRRCHPAKYESYQRVGMARSLRRPETADVIEDFGREFYHEPSQRYYQIRRDGDALVFRRHQLDDAGEPINVFETPVAWVLGSGNRARSYLYRNPAGELYQLPLGWYSETKSWGMSPGFEAADHPGLQRRVEMQCMFCHNAYPEVPAGSDWSWQADRFPAELPEGTGCQRCHGPGADHVRAVLSGADLETIHDRIVNPRKLPPERRDSVCFQCHMLPSVTLIGARRFDRPVYSFRPGESLADYLAHVEIEDETIPRSELFEINHHGYRLWQSRCYRESAGELACISCHDPHVKPESNAFRGQVAGVCRQCHEDWATAHPDSVQPTETACVGCHMPTRRTRDVVLVTMTDHRIARGPFDAAELVAPLKPREPLLTGIELLPFGNLPTGEAAAIHRILPVLRAYSDTGAARALENILERSPQRSVVPYLDLLQTQLKLQANDDAERTARLVLERQPDLFRAYTWLGLAQFGQGRYANARASLERSLALAPTPEAHYNLALTAFHENRIARAEVQLDAALALRPHMPLAWRYRGRIANARGDLDTARDAFRRALEIDPGDHTGYADLIGVLRRRGESEAAQRYLRVGLRVARNPSALEKLVSAE